MSSRIPSHQLSNGLYVSGRPEQPKEKTPIMSSVAMPYTGGDIKKSGELGKMFDIPVDGSKTKKSGPITAGNLRSGSFGGVASHSGPIMPNATARTMYTTSGSLSSQGISGSASLQKSNSGPLSKHGEPVKKLSGPQSCGVTPTGRQNSGPLPPALPATGLITSGPISSGPLNSSGAPRKVSGPLESVGSLKLQGSAAHSHSVTTLTYDDDYSFAKNFPKIVLWSLILLFVMGFIAGGFILGAVHSAILLIVVVILFGAVCTLFIWNTYWGRRAHMGFISRYPDSELRTAKNGQFVKVSGRHVVDFYISDFQSGLRALVKTGYGARVTPYVDDPIVIDVNPVNEELSPDFIRWLGERNLSSDGRVMRLREGHIKEGSTVSVMGVVQRNENVLMIVPPPDPIAIGCEWSKCIFPPSIEGIVLQCEDASKNDVIPV
ncbi:uncharacterized membrane protein At1g16860-like isoform X2 [Cucurbita maxima]|uniref:Uncharacterized membrane protein At1g16860-like isoform X2 n=1 Tax=Cucurbita maxima TaxID=3661 RepID=A0A6J1KHM9_CUCMA|nr:uncharacterized membrane protein At1g16860-like isoform X2 [Cucurbita maxima]